MYFIFFLIILSNTELPVYPTEEEKERMDEVGTYTEPTSPPTELIYAPGEYDHARGVLLRWSDSYQQLYIDLVDTLINFTKVFLVCNSPGDSASIVGTLQSNGIPLDSIGFLIRYTNSVWIRDYGPWWIYHEDGQRGITDWNYNRPRPDDDTFNIWLGSEMGIPAYISSLIHTGGNFLVDGHGIGFASNLIYQENPSLSQSQVQQELKDYMGLDTLFVMDRINGEYTGHIDMWGKLIDDNTFLVASYPPGDPNYGILNQHARTISNLKNGNGINFDTVRIPSPPVSGRAYRSYTNSLILNKNVLLPVYGHSYDAVAESLYQALLPNYNIYTFDCSDIIQSGGAVHCISKLIHHSSEIIFTHNPLKDREYTSDPDTVKTEIFSTAGLKKDSVFLCWKNSDSTNFLKITFTEDNDTTNLFRCEIPPQTIGTTVEYYIEARDSTLFIKTTPLNVPHKIYSFSIIDDTTSPVITHTPLGDITLNTWPPTIRAEVTDNLAVDSVFIEFYINTLPSDTLPMVKESPYSDTYSVTLTGNVNTDDEIFYRILARDSSTNQNHSFSPDTGFYNFTIVESIQALILDLDETPITGPYLDSLFTDKGISHNYTTSFDTTLFPDYSSLFVLLGVYPNNEALTTQQANAITHYLDDSGKIYMEGGDCWAYDATRTIYNPYFGINGVDDGGTMSTPVNGITGTFTEGMSFDYSGENNWMDEISGISSGYLIFTASGVGRGVANSHQKYRTVGLSFELGGLLDGSGVSRRDSLILRILDFFDLYSGLNIVTEYKSPVFFLKRNPSPGEILIGYIASGNTDIRLFDIAGREVYSKNITLNEKGIISIKPRYVPSGLYFIDIRNKNTARTLKCIYIK